MLNRILAAAVLIVLASAVNANDGQSGASFDPDAYEGEAPIPEKKPDLRTVTVTYCSGQGCNDEPKSKPAPKKKKKSDKNGGDKKTRKKATDVAVDVILKVLNKGCIGGGCKYADEAYEKGKGYLSDGQIEKHGDKKTRDRISDCLNNGNCD